MESKQLRKVFKKDLLPVIKYADQYEYPLLLHEVWYWQIKTTHSLEVVREALKHSSKTGRYYHLENRGRLVNIRKKRYLESRQKWQKALVAGRLVTAIPFVKGVFVTGSLSMNNTKPDDDIDFMIVTSTGALWITRLCVVMLLKLKSLRRPTGHPEHSSPQVSDKICDNLYLELGHLRVSGSENKKNYLAHEILQAKCIENKNNSKELFFQTNSWVRDFLPIAYDEVSQDFSVSKTGFLIDLLYRALIYPINLLAYVVQWVYMSPKVTREKISLNQAFFHPNSQNQ